MTDKASGILPRGTCRWTEDGSVFLVHSGLLENGTFTPDEIFALANGRQPTDVDLICVLDLIDADQPHEWQSSVDIEKPQENLIEKPVPGGLPPADMSMAGKHPILQHLAAERHMQRFLGVEPKPPSGRISIDQFNIQGGKFLDGQTGVDFGSEERKKSRSRD